jgi:predicted homoserine dehydrogenase-like protein
MIIVDNLLKERELTGKPIKIGVVGTGQMGRGIINQIKNHSKGIVIAGAYNRTIEKAEIAFLTAGITEFKKLDYPEQLEKHDPSIPFITNNIDVLLESGNIDMIIEVTGTVNFAAHTILKAFKAGKNVLSFNVEIDATLGPLLKIKSKESGVLYSVSDGDQPGVTMNLYRFVKGMGFNPLLCGNIKGLQDHYRNPTTQKEFARKWGLSAEMATSFADGTKISFEQACIANATKMKVACRGMFGHYSEKHIDQLTSLYDYNYLKEVGGIVDYVVGAKPGPGVFIYADNPDEFNHKYLEYAKMGKGPMYSFYVPYHLLFFEITASICRLTDLKDYIVTPLDGPVVEVVANAKTDLKPGSKLDGLGGYFTYGVCENATVARDENLLPIGMAEGLIIKREIPKDQTLTFDDVEIEQDEYLLQLYNQQCENFKLKKPEF